MNFSLAKTIEYLCYAVTLSCFFGKSYKVVAGLLIVFFLIDVIKEKKWIIFKDNIFILLSLWCFYLLLSTFWSVNYISAMKGSLELFVWCLMYLAIKATLSTQKQVNQFLLFQSIVVLFIILNLIAQLLLGKNIFGTPLSLGRVTDLLSHERQFAYIFPLWIGLFGAYLSTKMENRKQYLLFAVTLIGILLAIPLSGQRGPILLLAFFLPLIAWMSPFRKIAFSMLGAVVVAFCIMIVSSPSLQERFQTLLHPFENQKHTRVAIWLTAFEEFKGNPVLGVGFRNFRDRQFEYYKESFESHEINPKTGSIAYHAHSPWMDILAEQGMVGIAFAFVLLFSIARMIYRTRGAVFIGSLGVWYSFSLLNSGFSLSSGRWSFFMILSIAFFSIIHTAFSEIKQQPDKP